MAWRRGASPGLVTTRTESLAHLLSACCVQALRWVVGHAMTQLHVIHGAQTFWGPRGLITWGCELAQGHLDAWWVAEG